MRILWIEDDPTAVAGTQATLEFIGHEVIVEDDPTAARDRLRAEAFDVLVVDEWLDENVDRHDSGSDIVADLKNGKLGEANLATPFMFVTGDAEWVGIGGANEWPGYFGVVPKSSDLSRQITDVVDRLVLVPGLTGPNGSPLLRGAAGYRDLAVRFGAINQEALSALAAHPELMQEMHWRDFEELIAELFARGGFEVTLTPQSGDRGADLYAARHTSLGSLLYVVECKRFRHGRHVGPGLVRELRGVVDRERATCGVLATTSYFSPGAMEEQRTSPFRLALRDLEHVTEWVRGKAIME